MIGQKTYPTLIIWLLNLLFVVVVLLWSGSASAQGAQEVYGKSRIQYRTFKWQYLSSTNFDIYYYADSSSMARNAARYAEEEFVRISDLMGFSPFNKIRIYLYTTRAELLQSNVGLEAENNTIGGRTNFVKNLIEIAYPGSQVGFKQAIAEGIASKLAYDMMFGGSLKEMVQNSYLLLLPDWFMSGMVKYASQGWSRELDDYIRDQMLNNGIRQPSNLLGEKAAIVGQSIWNYVAQRYGPNAISNVLNQTRLQRDEEESIMISLGIPYIKFIRDWKEWYQDQAQHVKSNSLSYPVTTTSIRFPKNRHTFYPKLSADGKYMAYTSNNLGAYQVMVRDLSTGKTKTCLKGGYKVLNQSADFQTPILAWEGNNVLHMVRHLHGKLQHINYNITSKKSTVQQLKGIDQVNSLDVTKGPKGTQLLMSADLNGQTNIVVLRQGNEKPEFLTNDLYDDLQARWIGDTAIAFSSNRLSDTLKGGRPDQIANCFDLWQMNFKTKQLFRLTRTWYNETNPVIINEGNANKIYFLGDLTGVNQLYQYNPNRKPSLLTNNVQEIQYLDIVSSVAGIYVYNRKEHIVIDLPAAFPTPVTRPKTNTIRIDLIGTNLKLNARKTTGLNIEQLMSETTERVIEPDTVATKTKEQAKFQTRQFRIKDTLSADDIDIRNYIFESEKGNTIPVKETTKNGLFSKKSSKKSSGMDDFYKESKRLLLDDKALAFGPYKYQNRMNFSSIVTSIEVNPLIGWGFHLQSNMTDLFEHHKMYAGGTLFTDFTSNILFGEYQYLARHLDFKVRYDRKLFSNAPLAFTHRYVLDKFSGTVSYPINIKSNVSVTPFFAQTRFTTLPAGAGSTTLNQPDVVVPYGGGKLEYVFDNTLSLGVNILEGTRIKGSVEHYNGLGESGRTFTNINLDARHYQKVYNEVILALRASYGSSFGNAPKQFLLGGMDNWLNNTSVKTGILDETGGGPNGKTDWLFTQYATNMRGFAYNTLSGNSYLLFSGELRIPVVRAFYRGTISSNFMRHLQLTAFSDIGSAWNGANPFTTDNSINTKTYRDGPFTIKVINYDSPFLIGYGIGARTIFLGYYVKLDVAQGLKNYNTGPLLFCLTLGYDF